MATTFFFPKCGWRLFFGHAIVLAYPKSLANYETLNRLDRSALGKIFDNVALLALEDDFPGTTWLTQLCDGIWEKDNTPENWFDRYGGLLELLYKISFLGIVESGKQRPVYYLSQSREENLRFDNLTTATHFTVHSSFRLGLRIKPTPVSH